MARTGRGEHGRPGVLLPSGRGHDAGLPSCQVLVGIVCRPMLPFRRAPEGAATRRMAISAETGVRALGHVPGDKRVRDAIHNDNNVL